MVRRILPDSDFEYDDEPVVQVITVSSDNEGPSSPGPLSPPRSSKRVIRTRKVIPKDVGTYDYNSDIYTDESSIGSFVVDDGDDHVYAASEASDDDADDLLDYFEALKLSGPETDHLTDSESEPCSPQLTTAFRHPSPHKESSPGFWDKDEHYAPVELNMPKQQILKASGLSPSKVPKALKGEKEFLRIRQQMAIDFVHEIDKKVMDGKLAKATTHTGGVKLVWNTRFRTCAGQARWKQVKDRNAGTCTDDLEIKLSTRLLTDERKLRKTLAHELCHCAVFVIDRDRESKHGKPFKRWGNKITKTFPDIVITTRHRYEIDHKYIYTCTNDSCCREYGRNKRLDLNRCACRSCHSKLMQTKPTPKSNTGKESKPNPFGTFVKEHFANVKKENPGSQHKEVMKIISERYHQQKLNGGKTVEDPILLEDSEEESNELGSSTDIVDML